MTKIEARSRYRKICLKVDVEALLHNSQGRDEKEGFELSVKSLRRTVSWRVDILNLKCEDY